MIGNFRYRTLKRWFRKPVLVLQVEQVEHHMMPLGGSGYYDEWQTKRWRDVRPDEAIASISLVSVPV